MGAALLSDPDKIEKVSLALKRSLQCACELELLGAPSLPSPEIERITHSTRVWKFFKRLPSDFDMQPDSGTPEPSCSSLGVPEKARARDMSAESQGP